MQLFMYLTTVQSKDIRRFSEAVLTTLCQQLFTRSRDKLEFLTREKFAPFERVPDGVDAVLFNQLFKI